MTEENQNQLNNFVSLSEASEISGYHSDYLGFLARTGKLEAQKIGRNWVTTHEAISDLMKQGNGRTEVTDDQGNKIKVHTDNQTHTPTENAAAATESSPLEAHAKLAELKREIITGVARTEAVKAAHETVLQTLNLNPQAAQAAATHASLPEIKATAQKIQDKQKDAEQQKQLDERLQKFQSDMQAELEKQLNKKISAIAHTAITAVTAAAVAGATSAKAAAKNIFTGANSTLHLGSSAEAIEAAAVAGAASKAPKQLFTGLNKSFQTPSLNLDKIYASFQHRFDLAKYLALGMGVVTLVLGGAIGYNRVQTNRQLAQIQATNKLVATSGIQGPQGPQGPKGDKGEPGEVKYFGNVPQQKSSGQKIVYLQGPPGPPGPQGPAGRDGINGTNGINGTTPGSYAPGSGVIYSPIVAAPAVPSVSGANQLSAQNLSADTATLRQLTVTGNYIQSGTGTFQGASTFDGAVTFNNAVAFNNGLTLLSATAPQIKVGYDASNQWTAGTTSTGVTTFTFNGTAPQAIFVPQSDSANAFEFANAAGTSVLAVDTSNGRVGIGNTAPTTELDVTGAANVSGVTTLHGTSTIADTIGANFTAGNSSAAVALNGTTVRFYGDTAVMGSNPFTVATGLTTLGGNLTMNNAAPIIDSPAGTLKINTTTNQPVTFGTGNVTIPNLVVTTTQTNAGTITVNSTAATATVFGISAPNLTSGILVQDNLTANAGNGQVTKGFEINLTDATTAGGGYSAFTINVSGAGVGSGVKNILDLNPGANTEVVFDNTGSFRPTTSAGSNTNSIGSPSFYWKNGYFDTLNANSLSGTVITGATSSTTWTIGSTQTGDVNEAVVFQRNSGSGNALLQWNAGAGDLRYLSANYPFNSTYTVSDTSIGTAVNLYSGMLTNNTTSGTQKLLSLTNTGTGTTEDGVYINNTGTGTTALEIAGTWTNGIITNNNSINAGSGAISTTGTITAGTFNVGNINQTGTLSVIVTTAPQLTVGYDSTHKWTSSTDLNGSTTFSPSANTTTAFNFTKADGTTSVLNLDTTNGYVGIGTTAPASVLDVVLPSGTSGNVLTLSGKSNLGAVLPYSSLGLSIGNNGASTYAADLIFNTSSGGAQSEKMRIVSSGNVGIGTTSPIQKLEVNGSAEIANNNFYYGRTSSGAQAIVAGITSGDAVQLGQNNVNHTNTNIYGGTGYVTVNAGALEVARFTTAGNVGIGTTNPGFPLEISGTTSGKQLKINTTGVNGPSIGLFKSGTQYGILGLSGAYESNTTTDLALASDTTGGAVKIYTNGDASAPKLTVNSVGAVGIGTASPASSAILDLTSTTKAFLAPRMTSTQRDAIASPIAGLMIYNSTTNQYNVYNGTAWGAVGGGSGSSQWTTAGNGTDIYYTTGRVGIGTAGPAYALDVKTTPDATAGTVGYVNVGATGGVNQVFGYTLNDANYGVIRKYDGAGAIINKLFLRTGGSDNVVIDSTGQVGIGTTSPTSFLEAATTATGSTGRMKLGNTNTAGLLGWQAANDTAATYFTQYGSAFAGTNGIGLSAANSATLQFSNASSAAIYTTGAVPLVFGTNGAEVMRISGSSVGIGTTNPQGQLQVRTTDTSGSIRIGGGNSVGNSRIFIQSNGDNSYIDSYGGDAFQKLAINTSQLLLNAAAGTGNVGIGDTSPASKLTVNGDIRIKSGSGGVLYFADGSSMSTAGLGSATSLANTGDAVITGDSDANSAGDVILKTGSNDRLHIFNNGKIAIGSTTALGSLYLVHQPANGNDTFWQSAGSTNDVAPSFVTRFSRGTTSVPTTILSGDNTLSLVGQAYDGTGWNSAADIRFETEGTVATNRTPGIIKFQTHPDSTGAIATNMVLNSAGSLGIGTTAPTYRLNVINNAGVGAGEHFISAFGSGISGVQDDGVIIGYRADGASVTGGILRAANNKPLFMGTTTNPQDITVLDSGFVGIGTTNPQGNLHIVGSSSVIAERTNGQASYVLVNSNGAIAGGDTIGFLGGRTASSGSDYASMKYLYESSTNGAITFNTLSSNVSGERMRITSGGNVGIGTTTPGAQLEIDANSAPTIRLNATAAAGGAGNLQFYNSGTQQWNLTTLANSNDFSLYNNGGTNSYNLTILHSNGNVGIGTTNPSGVLDLEGTGNVQLRVGGTASGSTGNYGIISQPTFASGTTASGRGIYIGTSTAAAAFTMAAMHNLYIDNPTVGAGSAITTNYGIYLKNQTAGATNYGIYSEGGTDFFGGSVGVGTSVPATYRTGANNLVVTSSGDTGVTIRAGGATNVAMLAFGDNTGTNDGDGSNRGKIWYDFNAPEKLRIQTGAGLISNPAGITVDSSNNVGIGTTAPGYNLHVIGNIFASGNITCGGTCVGGGSSQWTTSGSNIYYNGGNVGIGTTTPGDLLEVSKDSISGAHGAYPAITVNNPNAAGYGAFLLYNGATQAGGLQKNTDNSLFLYTAPSTALEFATNSTERMRISATGNVGIGTTAPGDVLHVLKAQNAITNVQVQNTTAGTAAQAAFLAKSDTTNLYMGAHSSLFSSRPSVGFVDVQSNNDLDLLTNDTVRMTIQNTGNVGIGTTAPKDPLHVGLGASLAQPILGTAGGQLYLSSASTATFGTMFGVDNASGNGWIQEQRTDGSALAYNLLLQPSGGNVGIGTTAPAYKLDVNGAINATSVLVNGVAVGAGGTQWTSGTGGAIGYTGGSVGIGTTAPGNFTSLGFSGPFLDVKGFLQARSNGVDSVTGMQFGSALYRKAIISAPSGDADVPYLAFGVGTAANSSTGAEAMRILNTGSIGIGTTAPASKLDVTSSTGGTTLSTISAHNSSTTGYAGIDAFNDAGKELFLGTGGSATAAPWTNNSVLMSYDGAASLVFGTAGSEKMRILSSGNVGIGTTSPDAPLTVVTNSSVVRIRSGNTNWNGVDIASGLGSAQQIYTNYTGTATDVAMILGTYANRANQLSLATSGFVGIGTTAPQANLQVSGSGAGQLALTDTAAALDSKTWALQSTGGLLRLRAINDAYSSGLNSLVVARTGVSSLYSYFENGSVGIGNTAPANKLDVKDTVANPIRSWINASDTTSVLSALNLRRDTTGVAGNGMGVGLTFQTQDSSANSLNVGGINVLLPVSSAQNADMTFNLMQGGSAGVEMARFKGASGNLGVGTATNITERVVIPNNNFFGGVKQDGSSTRKLIGFNSSNQVSVAADNDTVVFGTGNLGVANTAPTRQIQLGSASTLKTAIGQSLLYMSANAATLGNTNEIGFGNATDTNPQAAVGSIVTDATGNANSAIYFATRNLTTDSVPTERMRITSAGNVGIGTTNPGGTWGRNLQIYNSTGSAGISFKTDAATARQWDVGVNPAAGGTSQDLDIYDATAGVHRLVIKGDTGNVGIGTTNPGNKLDVNGGINTVGLASTSDLVVTESNAGLISTLQLRNSNAGVGAGQRIAMGNDASSAGGTLTLWSSTNSTKPDYFELWNQFNAPLTFGTSGTEQMRIAANGKVGIGTTAPSGLLEVRKDQNGETQLAIQNQTDGTASDSRIDIGGGQSIGTRALTIWQAAPSNTSSVWGISSAKTSLILDNTSSVGGASNGLLIGTNSSTAPLIFGAGNAERMRFDPSSGNVGIGTTNPLRHLSLSVNNASVLEGLSITNQALNGGVGILFNPTEASPGTGTVKGVLDFASNALSSGNGGFLATQSNDPLALGANSTEYLRIATSGNIGIGTTSPATALEVSNVSSGVKLRLSGYANARRWDLNMDSAGLGVLFNGGTEALKIAENGNVGIGTASPTSSNGNVGRMLEIAAAGTALSNANPILTLSTGDAANTGIGMSIEARSTGTRTGSDKRFGQLVFAPDDISTTSGYTAFYTNNGGSSFTEKMRISSNGNIGIGNTGPVYKLSVATTDVDTALQLNNTGTGGNNWIFDSANNSSGQTLFGGDLLIRDLTTSKTALEFKTDGSAIFKSGGGVGIGTVPSTIFDVADPANAGNSGGFRFTAATSTSDYTAKISLDNTGMKFGHDSASRDLELQINSATQFTINTNGTLRFNAYGAGTLTTDAFGNVTASSDERLKNIQGSFNDSLSSLMGIKPILYKWNDISGMETQHTYAGFSAQNIQANIPEAVSVDSRGYLTLADRPILAAAVNAIKDLNGITVKNSETLSSSAVLQAGEIVASVDAQNASVSSSDYDPTAVGVVSGATTSATATTTTSTPYNVVTSGTARILVTNENGAIKIGDYLTTSASMPGYAMKAVHSGLVIGRATAAFDPSAGSATMTTSVVNGVTIYTDTISADVKVAYENINNTYVMGTDVTAAQTVTQSTTSTSTLGSVNSALTYVIRQAAQTATTTTNPDGTTTTTPATVADILQVQSGSVTRLMVSQNGATTINTTVAADAIDASGKPQNIFVVRNNDADQFTIAATGDVTVKAALYVNGKLYVTDNHFAGAVITDSTGKAKITFVDPLLSQPVVNLTPVAGGNAVFATVDSFEYDANGNIIAVDIDAYSSGGAAATGIKVNYLVVMTESSVDHTYVAPTLSVTSAPATTLSSPTTTTTPTAPTSTTTSTAPTTTTTTSSPTTTTTSTAPTSTSTTSSGTTTTTPTTTTTSPTTTTTSPTTTTSTPTTTSSSTVTTSSSSTGTTTTTP